MKSLFAKTIIALTGLAAAALLAPAQAAAVPSDYEIRSGRLTLEIEFGRHSFDYRVNLQGGSFTFDDETGIVSDLTVGLRTGGALAFDSEIDAGDDFRLVGNSGLRLNLVGIDLPDGVLPGYVGDTADLRIRAREIAVTPVVPLPPVAAVPEPTAALLFGAGLLAVGTQTRKTALKKRA